MCAHRGVCCHACGVLCVASCRVSPGSWVCASQFFLRAARFFFSAARTLYALKQTPVHNGSSVGFAIVTGLRVAPHSGTLSSSYRAAPLLFPPFARGRCAVFGVCGHHAPAVLVAPVPSARAGMHRVRAGGGHREAGAQRRMPCFIKRSDSGLE